MATEHLTFAIMPGEHGGAAFYEMVGENQEHVFSGDLDACVEYFRQRLAERIVEAERPMPAIGSRLEKADASGARMLVTPRVRQHVEQDTLERLAARDAVNG
jgi:hypothetical protein